MGAEKVTAGQKVGKQSASFRNALVDLVNADKAGVVRNKPQQPKQTPRNDCRVKVKNSSGGNIRRGEVLEFTDFLLTDLEADYLWFDGDTPDMTNVGWGLAIRPVPNGDIDEFQVLGVCIAWVNITDEAHEYATRADGEIVLQSAASGPVKILFKPTGGTPPEERECVVQIMDEQGSSGGGLYFARPIDPDDFGDYERSDPLLDEDEDYCLDPDEDEAINADHKYSDMIIIGPPDSVGDLVIPGGVESATIGRVINYTPFGYYYADKVSGPYSTGEAALKVIKTGDVYIVEKPAAMKRQPLGVLDVTYSNSSHGTSDLIVDPTAVTKSGYSVFGDIVGTGVFGTDPPFTIKYLPRQTVKYRVHGYVIWGVGVRMDMAIPILTLSGIDIDSIIQARNFASDPSEYVLIDNDVTIDVERAVGGNYAYRKAFSGTIDVTYNGATMDAMDIAFENCPVPNSGTGALDIFAHLVFDPIW